MQRARGRAWTRKAGCGPAAKNVLDDLHADRKDNVKFMQAIRAALGVSRFSAYSSDEDGEHSDSDSDGADAGAMSAPDAAEAGNHTMMSPSHASWVHRVATIMKDRPGRMRRGARRGARWLSIIGAALSFTRWLRPNPMVSNTFPARLCLRARMVNGTI
jgi:hypothetical protein